MSKKQSTLIAAIETTEVPGVQDFVVDGNQASLSFQAFTIVGGTVAITATELLEKGYTLDYDGQTANFTVGRTLVGTVSNARGVIMDDTDGGATGTLELKKVVGHFQDNEPLQEEISGVETSAAAIANGTLTRVLALGDVWATIGATAVDVEAEFINPSRAASEADRYTVYPRRFRLTFTEGGTLTAARFSVDLIQSGV